MTFNTGTGFQFQMSGEEQPPSILVVVVCGSTTALLTTNKNNHSQLMAKMALFPLLMPFVLCVHSVPVSGIGQTLILIPS